MLAPTKDIFKPLRTNSYNMPFFILFPFIISCFVDLFMEKSHLFPRTIVNDGKIKPNMKERGVAMIKKFHRFQLLRFSAIKQLKGAYHFDIPMRILPKATNRNRHKRHPRKQKEVR